MLAQHTGLLVDAEASEPLSPGVVLPAGASTLGCTTEVSASLTEHMGPDPGLAAVERNQGRASLNQPDSFGRGPP